MNLKWQQAPVKTQWGDDMVVASVSIDNDHTVCLYCERDQIPKVEAMFAQRTWVGLTDEDGIEYPYPPAKPPIYATAKNTKAVRDGFEMGGYEKEAGYYSEAQLDEFARSIEAKLKEKNT